MSFFIYLIKKNIFFLKKYILELYLEDFNYRFLKNKNKILKKKISILKTVIKIKLNEDFFR